MSAESERSGGKNEDNKEVAEKRGQQRRGKQRGGRNEDNEEEAENKRRKKRGPQIRNL